MGTTQRISLDLFAAPTQPFTVLPACRRPWPAQTGRALRITRIADDTRQPGHAGRMRISGRLADVCAELERLARLEAN